MGVYEEAEMNMCHGFLCKEGIWTRCHLNSAMIPSNVVSDHSTSVLYFIWKAIAFRTHRIYAYNVIFQGKSSAFFILY